MDRVQIGTKGAKNFKWTGYRLSQMEPKTLNTQGIGCHKGSQKLLKDRVQGLTKTLNGQSGVIKGTKNFE